MRSTAIALLVLVMTVMTATARAQPGVMWPAPAPPNTQIQVGELSESTALWLSLGGTAASWGLIVLSTQLSSSGEGVAVLAALGTVGAPSLGHLYAESFATRGLGLRLGGAALSFLGGMLMVMGTSDGGRLNGSERTVTYSLMFGGAAMYAAGTIDDIVTAPAAARRYNRKLRGLALAPMVSRDSGGVMLATRF